MNIFQTYLEKIHKVIIELANNNKIIIPESLAGINAEVPPAKFDSDISTNVAMVLSKLNIVAISFAVLGCLFRLHDIYIDAAIIPVLLSPRNVFCSEIFL